MVLNARENIMHNVTAAIHGLAFVVQQSALRCEVCLFVLLVVL